MIAPRTSEHFFAGVRIALYVTLASTLAFLVSCSKPSEPSDAAPKTATLVSTAWQVVEATALVNGQNVSILASFPIKSVVFNANGTYSAASQTGTWEFTDNETKIAFDKNSALAYVSDVLELNTSVLRLRQVLPINGQNAPVEVKFAPLASLPSSPETNFETLWREFDARYSFFIVKNINWDSLYKIYRPQVASQTTDAQLFQLMRSLLENLKDGHVSLSTPLGVYAYQGWYANYPSNFLGVSAAAKYFSKDYGSTAGASIRYARLADSLGYMYVGQNLTGDVAAWGQAADAMLDSLAGVKGIIIDIRNNTGGNDALGKALLSRFTDKERTYSYVQFRNGANHADFTALTPATIAPQGARQFLKPVAFLTNRRCFSSAEGTTLMARALPNVTIIGDTTGGGSANPIELALPNGWKYRVSRWIQYTAEKTVFEGVGLAPHIPVRITPADSAAGRDAILERAIELLRR